VSAKPATTEDLPLYIRWGPDRTLYGIELRLDLVPRIAVHVNISKELGTEVGGLLIGSLIESPIPTLRIENVEMVSNGSDDDTVFLPEPSRLQTYAGSARNERETGIVGFFRTHARIGPMRPSLADRSIFAQEFRNSPYAVLLIQAQPPHSAAFFIAASGQLPDEPSVREFEFDESAFKALPEVPPEGAEAAHPVQATTGRLGLYARIAALILIAIAACALMWSFARQPMGPRWFGSADQLQLAISSDDKLLRISWNHSAKDLNQATGATLVINQGGQRSELQLGMDDLRLGSVEYQGTGGQVNAQIILNMPTGPVPADSAKWPSR
jgi:hypothetical protein